MNKHNRHITISLILALLIVGDKPSHMEYGMYRYIVHHMQFRIKRIGERIIAGAVAIAITMAIIFTIVFSMVWAWNEEAKTYYAKNPDNNGYHLHNVEYCDVCDD